MKQVADDAVQHAALSGMDLDFTEESLVKVDQLLAGVKADLANQKPQVRDDYSWTIAQLFGAYLGEVVIQSLGGEWRSEEHNDGSVSLVIIWNQITMYPLDKVFKKLTRDDFDAVQGYVRALRAIAANRRADV